MTKKKKVGASKKKDKTAAGKKICHRQIRLAKGCVIADAEQAGETVDTDPQALT